MTEAVASEEDRGVESPGIPLYERSQSLEGQWVGTPPSSVENVRIDSRNVSERDLFVALQGSETHGHEFVQSARESGAVAAIVEERQPIDCPQFVTPDSRNALQRLAVLRRRARTDLCVIGVTGTCGKTTVKEMIAHLLDPKYVVGKTPGNYNNQLGVPLTILNHSHGDVLVAELATSGPGEIERLTRWAQPVIGVITHVGPAHLEGLGDVSSVVEEKGDLFAGLPNDGIAILPDWVDGRERLREKSAVPPKLLGQTPEAGYSPEWTKSGDVTDFRLNDLETELPFQGEHLVKDAAMAAAVALELGVAPSLIEQRLSSFEPLEGRGRVTTIGDTQIMDDVYNANPDSFRAALERLAELPPPRLAVVGDMKEMGEQADEYHRVLGKRLADLEDTDVLYVGEFGEAVENQFDQSGPIQTVKSVEDLPAIELSDYASALVKASNSVGLNQLLERWRDGS